MERTYERRRNARPWPEAHAMRPDRRRRPGRGRRPERKRSVQVFEDTEGVFRAAIAARVLSADPCDPLYAGRYLYMFHDEEGTAWFRRYDARAWVSMSARRRAAGERS